MKVWLTVALSTSAIIGTGTLYASDSVLGRVISREPIEIDGIRVPARNYMPVNSGSEIVTHASAASIQFADGSSVFVNPNSQIHIDSGYPYVKVLTGKILYTDRNTSKAVSSASVTARLPLNPIVAGGTLRNPLRPVSTVTLGSVAGHGSTAFTGVFSPRTPGTSGTLTGQIISPSGLIFNVTYAGTNNNGAATYTVTSVTVPVTLSSSGSTTGTANVTVTNSTFVGTTVTLVTSGNTSALTFTSSTGTLSSAQVNNATTSTQSTAVSTEQQQVGSGSTVTPSTTGNVSTASFSPKAS